jgi:hypothetical protein
MNRRIAERLTVIAPAGPPTPHGEDSGQPDYWRDVPALTVLFPAAAQAPEGWSPRRALSRRA